MFAWNSNLHKQPYEAGITYVTQMALTGTLNESAETTIRHMFWPMSHIHISPGYLSIKGLFLVV